MLSAKKGSPVLVSGYTKFVWIFASVLWVTGHQATARGRKECWKHTFLSGMRHIILATSRSPAVTEIVSNMNPRGMNRSEAEFWNFSVKGSLSRFGIIDPRSWLSSDNFSAELINPERHQEQFCNSTRCNPTMGTQPTADSVSKSSSQHITNTDTRRHCRKPSGQPRDFIIAFTAAPSRRNRRRCLNGQVGRGDSLLSLQLKQLLAGMATLRSNIQYISVVQRLLQIFVTMSRICVHLSRWYCFQ